MDLTIDGIPIEVKSFSFGQEELGGQTRSINSTLMDNRLYSLGAYSIETPLMNVDRAENLYNYLLADGEIYRFDAANEYWHYSSKGNVIESNIGTIDQNTTIGFRQSTRGLRVTGGARAVLSTPIGDEYTVIARVSINTTSNGQWNYIARSSSGGTTNVIYQNSIATSAANRRWVTNRLTIEGDRIGLNGRDNASSPVGGQTQTVFYSQVIILNRDMKINANTLSTFFTHAQENGNVSTLDYHGNYPRMKMGSAALRTPRGFVYGRVDTGSLSIHYDNGANDRNLLASLRFTIEEDRLGTQL